MSLRESVTRPLGMPRASFALIRTGTWTSGEASWGPCESASEVITDLHHESLNAWNLVKSGTNQELGVYIPPGSYINVMGLTAACMKGAHQSVWISLGCGADVSWPNSTGDHLLLVVALNGHDETVRVLLNFGADSEGRNGPVVSRCWTRTTPRSVRPSTAVGSHARRPRHITSGNAAHIVTSHGHHEIMAI